MIFPKKHPPSIQKRSFLLFEVLISLALITLCLFPLLKPHIGIQKKQKERLEKIQLERFSKAAFCKVKEKLCENKTWSWHLLLKGVSGELDIPANVYLGGKEPLAYQTSYHIQKMDNSTKKDGALVLQVDIYFTSRKQHKIGPFSHTFFVQGEKIYS